MYIMLSLCRSHNNRRHQHKCFCYYMSDGLIDRNFAQCFTDDKKTSTFENSSYGVLTLYAFVLYCVQKGFLVPTRSIAFSLHACIETHFHMTQLWNGVRRCSCISISALTRKQEQSCTDALSRVSKLEVSNRKFFSV